MKKEGFFLRVDFHGTEFQRNCSVCANPARVLISLDANWFMTPQMDTRMNLQLMTLPKCSSERKTVEVTHGILRKYHLLSKNCKSHPAHQEKGISPYKIPFFDGALPAPQIELAKYFGKASPLPQIPCGCGTRALGPHHGVASAPSFPHQEFLVAAGIEGRGKEEDHVLLLIQSRLLVEIPTPGDGGELC